MVLPTTEELQLHPNLMTRAPALTVLMVLALVTTKSQTLRPVPLRDSLAQATEPGVRITWLWVAAQAVPSPEWSFSREFRSQFGLGWQITPLLHSFGINRRLSPWRVLVAEPIVRHNGSIEIFVQPTWLSSPPPPLSRWIARAGLRCYVPLAGYGEDLSGSVAISYARQGPQASATYEAGLYMFFGILGLQVSHSPGLVGSPWSLRIALSYF